MRSRDCAYMRWSKEHAAARYNLANSGVLGCSPADLTLPLDDLPLNSPHADGLPALKEAIAAQYGVEPEQVVLAEGASGANWLALSALVDPGDEVLVEEPVYGPLTSALEFLGAEIRLFGRRFEDGYRPDLGEIEERLSERTRLIVLTNPHNPSGVLLPSATVSAIGELAARVNARVLVDEVYRDIWFEAALPSHVHYGEHFLATNSLTKSYGLSGLRCGWVLASSALADRVRRTYDFMAASGPAPAQHLALAAFRQLPRLAGRSRALLEPNHDLVREFLAAHEDLLEAVLPERSLIVFPRLRSGGDTQALHDALRRHETSIVPGRFFAAPRHFRLGFAVRTEDVSVGLEKLRIVLRSG